MAGALKAAFTVTEKMALAFLFAMGVKSLILFALIRTGIRPLPGIQIGAILLVLVLTVLLTRPMAESPHREFTPLLVRPVAESSDSNASRSVYWQTVFSLLLISMLFLFSVVNAWFFPITEPDAAWYQVKGLSFFHEVRFDSEWVDSQLRQYPPFIPLLYSWFIAFGVEPIRMVFPGFYLAIILIFYCRMREFTNNPKMSAMFTLVLATTPYIWWHGVLPFLDLCTAVFYSAGALYWFFLMESLGVDRLKEKRRTMAFLSGLFFGLSAWNRLEFLLYGLIAVGLTLCAETSLGKEGERDRKSFRLFFFSLLVFPTIWFLNLTSFNSSLFGSVKLVGAVGIVAWGVVLVFLSGNWKPRFSTLIKAVFLVGIIFFAFVLWDGSGTVPGWKKLSIALYRSLVIHGFYLFTVFLSVFIFFNGLKNISPLNKLFGMFLVLYPLVHFAIFSYASPKWETFGDYLSATFIQPGNSVNLSDTRAVMSMYPLLLFFIAGIPFVRRGFDDV